MTRSLTPFTVRSMAAAWGDSDPVRTAPFCCAASMNLVYVSADACMILSSGKSMSCERPVIGTVAQATASERRTRPHSQRRRWFTMASRALLDRRRRAEEDPRKK